MVPKTGPQRTLTERAQCTTARDDNLHLLNKPPMPEGKQQEQPADVIINIITNEVSSVRNCPDREKRIQFDNVETDISNDVLDFPASSSAEIKQQVHPAHVAIDIPNAAPPANDRTEGDQETQSSNVAITFENGVSYGGDTVLHIAASFGHLEQAKKSFKRDRSLLQIVNRKLETPLHYAAQAGKHKVVALFIQLAQMEILRWRNQDGETALYQAVRNKHLSVVKLLIHADPNLASLPDNNNVSPLYLAAMQESTDIVSVLVNSFNEKEVPEAYAGPAGQTALHAAAFKPKGGIRSILSWKPDLAEAKDDTGSTPLHYAVSVNNITAVELLMQTNKASAYIADSSGLFSMHIAASFGYLKVISRLLEVCPDSDELLDAQGKNFFHVAVEEKKVHLVRWVCNNGRLAKAINAKDNEGNTPIHLAVKSGHLKTFAVLQRCKTVDKGIMNKKGLTPLDLAAAQKKTGLFNWQNQEYIIYRTLKEMRSCEAIKRTDHFLKEHELKMDRQKMEKEAENYESIAKNLSIGSVLIASASSAGAFTVSAAYKTDFLGGYNSFASRIVFKAFLTMVSFSFISSIMATGLLIAASLTYLDTKYRKRNVIICVWLVLIGIKGFIVAFSLGLYVVLRPVFHPFAFGISAFVIILPILYEQHFWPNIFVMWPLMRLVLWKEFTRMIHRTIDHVSSHRIFQI